MASCSPKSDPSLLFCCCCVSMDTNKSEFLLACWWCWVDDGVVGCVDAEEETDEWLDEWERRFLMGCCCCCWPKGSDVAKEGMAVDGRVLGPFKGRTGGMDLGIRTGENPPSNVILPCCGKCMLGLRKGNDELVVVVDFPEDGVGGIRSDSPLPAEGTTGETRSIYFIHDSCIPQKPSLSNL